MMLTTLLLASSALLTSAFPTPQFPPPAPDTQFYYLKIQTLPDSPHPEFNGLYLEGYHTGAGLNDVTFQTQSTSPRGFLNSTFQQFEFGSDEGQYLPYTMVMTNDNYASFSPVEINAGYGSGLGVFYFNETASGSLWWNIEGNITNPYYNVDLNSFGGWLACNWVHQDLPQLFWLDSPFNANEPLPSNCANIYLVPENLGVSG
ncbi:MAG: hypothetical protein Q9162_005284 [Coniocarpon cinnabarinum]